MSTTAIEPIPAQPKGTRATAQVVLPPPAGHKLRWSLFVVFAAVILLTVILGLVQKWLWMRELSYLGCSGLCSLSSGQCLPWPQLVRFSFYG